jgi:hypothetical protein
MLNHVIPLNKVAFNLGVRTALLITLIQRKACVPGACCLLPHNPDEPVQYGIALWGVLLIKKAITKGCRIEELMDNKTA